MRALAAFAAALLLALPLHAAELGEDGLHKQPWLKVTFKDMAEDLETASAEGKRFAVIFEQRGCIYCTKMHEEVLVDPEIAAFIEEHFYVVQMNLFGDEEVTDFDGEALPEKQMARRWGVVFTPTIMFLPESLPAEGVTAAEAAVAVMPGAFGRSTVLDMFRWIEMKGYEGDEHFQKFHAREHLKRVGDG